METVSKKSNLIRKDASIFEQSKTDPQCIGTQDPTVHTLEDDQWEDESMEDAEEFIPVVVRRKNCFNFFDDLLYIIKRYIHT